MFNINVSFTRVINIILTIILLGIIIFGWWYLNGINPLEFTAEYDETDAIRHQYLYTIYGSPNLRLNRPSYTAVSGNEIFVADTNNSRVAVFDYTGKYLRDIGKMSPGQLISPVGLAFVGNNLYVSDSKTAKIHIFSKNGTFKKYLELKTKIVPSGIFFKKDKLYVIDSKSMTLNVFDMSGNILKKIGGKGTETGRFYFPYTVYVTDNEEIFVADSNNNRIQVFDEKGKIIKILTGTGTDKQEIYSVPRGIAFDDLGNLYTSEGLNGKISVANKEGNVVTRFSDAEPVDPKIGIPDTLKLPTEVFIDDNKRLYVTEFGNSRILVYELK